jgi:hypothetical protein
MGCENTDPYVFGDFFKYATCSQTGKLTSLDPNSLILFGTTTDNGFELDTVFVVKTFEEAKGLSDNYSKSYSSVYFEETLAPLGEEYFISQKRLYHGLTWWDNKNYFSFVPCRVDNNEGFKKALLTIPPMAKQKVGHPYSHLNRKNNIELWDSIVNEVIKQGFCLGIRFTEPPINDKLLEGIATKKSIKDSGCKLPIKTGKRKQGCSN